MADTTPDVSLKDILSIVIRVCDELINPKEYLLKIRESLDKADLGIAKDIINILQANQIALNFLLFQSNDFEDACQGNFMELKQKFVKLLIRMSLMSHAKIIGRMQPLKTALEQVLSYWIYLIHCKRCIFFTSSPKRFRPLKEKMMELENAVSLKKLSKIRWVARDESLRAVTNSFEKIIKLLEDNSFNGNFDTAIKSEASGLRKKKLTFDFVIIMMFMKIISNKIQILTETIESPQLNVVDCKLIAESIINILEKMNEDTIALDNQISNHLPES